jgi:hypothetical protein
MLDRFRNYAKRRRLAAVVRRIPLQLGRDFGFDPRTLLVGSGAFWIKEKLRLHCTVLPWQLAAPKPIF